MLSRGELLSKTSTPSEKNLAFEQTDIHALMLFVLVPTRSCSENTVSMSKLFLYPNNIHPRSFEHLVANILAGSSFLVCNLYGLHIDLSKGSSALPLRQGARINDQDALDNLQYVRILFSKTEGFVNGPLRMAARH